MNSMARHPEYKHTILINNAHLKFEEILILLPAIKQSSEKIILSELSMRDIVFLKAVINSVEFAGAHPTGKPDLQQSSTAILRRDSRSPTIELTCSQTKYSTGHVGFPLLQFGLCRQFSRFSTCRTYLPILISLSHH